MSHGLVASFKSTLEEALDASLLLHVIDASDPGFERQIETTEEVLKEIDAQEVPRLRIFNKIDHVGDAAAQTEREAALRADYPGCIVMSARRPEDVAKLHKAILTSRRTWSKPSCFCRGRRSSRAAKYSRCDAFFRVRGELETLNSLRAARSGAMQLDHL